MLYVVGAQKAGTTWLHRYLQDHPECFVPPVKEAHYWDDRVNSHPLFFFTKRAKKLIKSIDKARANGKSAKAILCKQADVISVMGMHAGPGHDAYLEFMNRGRTTEPFMADITPAYCTLDRKSFREMSDLHPDCKFIFIMRDPVDRLWSGIRMFYEDHIAETGRSFEDYLKDFEGGIPSGYDSRSDYKRTVKELEAVIPAERLHFTFYETMVQPDGVADINAFIGLTNIAPDTQNRVHTGEKRVLPPQLEAMFHAKLNPQYRFVANRFGDQVPAKWRAVLPARVPA